MLDEENPFYFNTEDHKESDFIDATFGFFLFFSYELATIFAFPFRPILELSYEKANFIDQETLKHKKIITSLLIIEYFAIAISIPIGFFSLFAILFLLVP